MKKENTKSKDRNSAKRQTYLSLLYLLVVIVLITVISSFIYTRLDLTAEKRYTLSDVTKEQLKKIDDYAHFIVYLDGDMSADFKRLRNATKEMLDEFKAYNSYVSYEFVNPFDVDKEANKNEVIAMLKEKGLQEFVETSQTQDGVSQKMLFPCAILKMKGGETPIQLLSNQINVDPQVVMNNSIQDIEFNLINAVKKLSLAKKPRIVFIEGHGELEPIFTYDAYRSMKEYYDIEMGSIDGRINSLTAHRIDSTGGNNHYVYNLYDAAIIAKPTQKFSEKDKYIIDQYIMRGGKVLWLIDNVNAEMDSLSTRTEMMATPIDLGLEDMFFKYGFRINTNLVQDMNCLPITLVTGYNGSQPVIGQLPWVYFPMIIPTSNHPIVNNLNAIKTQFVSTIDTVKAKGIKKTVLLTTSKYSRTINAPAIVTLSSVSEKQDQRLFNKPNQSVALLLEGKFESLYKNRVTKQLAEDPILGFKESADESTRMIVISDGDVIRNQIHRTRNFPLPLGFDQDTRELFGNKELIMNAVNYLVDDSKIISIRSRELKLRLLDKAKVNENRDMWKVANVVVPVAIILILGAVLALIRRKRYSR